MSFVDKGTRIDRYLIPFPLGHFHHFTSCSAIAAPSTMFLFVSGAFFPLLEGKWYI